MWNHFVTSVSESLSNFSTPHLLAGMTAVVCVLARSLRFGLAMDDVNRERSKANLTQLPLWRKYIRNCIYSGACPGTKVWVEHLVTLLMHLTAVYLVGITFNWPTALLWATLATSVQQSVWLNGKRYILAVICVLLSLQWLPWSAVYLPIGVYFHYLAVPAVILSPWAIGIAGISWLVPRLQIRYRGWFLARYRVEGVSKSELTRLTPRKIIVAVKVYGFYFWKVLLPFKVAFFYRFMDHFGISKWGTADAYRFDWMFVRGLLAITATILGLFTPARWGLIWWMVFISMWCHLLVHVTQAVADRYTYLASIGLASAIVSVAPAEIYWAVFGMNLIALNSAMTQYRDLETFFRYNLLVEPKQARACRQYAQSLADSRFVHEAWRLVQNGIIHTPDDCNLNILAARLMAGAKRWGDAYRYIRVAEANPVEGSQACREYIARIKADIEAQAK